MFQVMAIFVWPGKADFAARPVDYGPIAVIAVRPTMTIRAIITEQLSAPKLETNVSHSLRIIVIIDILF
jgi:hypothetical protein